MTDLTNKRNHEVTSKVDPRLPELRSREDLATLIGKSLKQLNYLLYAKDRSAYYTSFEIKKSSGGVRLLHAVQEPLKKLQRATLEQLQIYWKPSGYAHGFAKGRSIITNAAVHRRKKIIIKVDIKNFFPSIHFGRVYGMFKAYPFRFDKDVATTLAQLSCVNDEKGVLPQGGVLSPYIANMICRHMDARLAELAIDNRCHFTRYADDITFSTNNISRIDTEGIIEKIYEIIIDEHFSPNKIKTKVLTPKDRQVVTGIVVNDGVNVNRRYIRNIRATLRNCEMYGIKSQVVRDKFHDDRSSRVSIQKCDEGFMLGNRSISSEEACTRFLKHLLGKITHVGQVVQSSGQDKNPERFQRVNSYQRMLLRFYRLIERSPEYSDIRKIVRGHIKKYPSIAGQLSLRDKQKLVKKDALAAYRDSTQVKQDREKVKSSRSEKELKVLVSEFSKNDPRFFRWNFSSDFEKDKKTVDEVLSYPAFDKDKTVGLLLSLRNSEDGLGALTHENTNFCAESAFDLLGRLFLPVYYYIPYRSKSTKKGDNNVSGVRGLFDRYIDALDKVVLEHGLLEPINVLVDPLLSEITAELKIKTRFGGNPSDATILKEVVQKAINNARSLVDPNEVEIKITELRRRTFYTDVSAIEWSMRVILHSMLKNTLGSNIKISASSYGQESFEIIVQDDSPGEIQCDPGRSFVNGKLSQAIRATNGLCQYILEGAFIGGNRKGVDMHTGKVMTPDIRFEQGVVHRLIFKTGSSEPVVEKTTSTTLDNLGNDTSQKKKVLLLDIRDQRRKRIEYSLMQDTSLILDSRSEISQDTYETADYDLVLAHQGNDEGGDIEDGWDSTNKQVVLYSGGLTDDSKAVKGRIYLRASYLESYLVETGGIQSLLDEVVQE